MKNGTKLTLLGVGLVALFAFKNKKKKSYKTYTLTSQVDAPAGSKQVYSKVGTKVYNFNDRVIYKFDFIGSGMTVTGSTDDKYIIVMGDTFMNGRPGWVYKNSVIV